MSNNTKRLSFFAKIAQRSTALQSLLEEATGKSARDSQGNVIAVEGLHDGHKPFVARPVYATERYQKDIELAQDTPTANSSNTSNAISSESINPNTESRVKHVKDFYRGESNWFMGEVGIKNYPFYRHVGWTAPAVTDGTLSATADGYPLNNGSAALGGSTIVFTATPATGKQVASWSGLPAGATTEGNTATFTLTSDVNVSATFEDVPAVVGPAVIEIGVEGGSEHITMARDEANDDDNPQGEGELPEKMYAWGYMNGYGRLGTASPTPSVGDPVWMYQGGWARSEESPAFVVNVTLGKCISVRTIEGLGGSYAFDGYNPVASTTYEGYYEWSGCGGTQLFTLSDTPSPLDVVYVGVTGALTEGGSVLMYSNILPVVQPIRFTSETEGAYAFVYVEDEPAEYPELYYRAANSDDDWTRYEFEEEPVQVPLPCEFKSNKWALSMDECMSFAIGGPEEEVPEDIVITGNITALCGKCGTTDNTIPDGYNFNWLFADSSAFKDASGLIFAENVTPNCYDSLFRLCDCLESVPEKLPATTLAESCYSQMFLDCTNLNEVHCAATDISATDCTLNWLSGVAESGDFYGKTAAGWTEGSASGIPSDWTAHLD